ncbi:MAG TPA: hypothetical protein VMM18_16280 [Gemmatimonadaceae bacterium]|nr:hypothetical protein [Gemmatimonadaceae bacterium]
MTRSTTAALALTTLALALACNRGGEGDGAATPGQTAAADTNACVTGMPTITAGGVGPVRLGATLADVATRCEVRDTSFTLGEGLEENGRVVALDGSTVVVLTDAAGRVTRIIVEDPSLRTERGLGVGSTVGELRRQHGQVCGDVAEGILVVSSASVGPITFATDADVRVARRGASINADAIPESARITSLWVHEGRALCGAS